MSNKLLSLVRWLSKNRFVRPKLLKFFNDCPISEKEKLLLNLVFIENRYRANTCDKFCCEKTKYHNLVNTTLAKIEHKFYREFFINYY